MQKLDLVTVGASFVLLAGIAVLLTKTLIGLQMRAASENFSMARLLRVRGNSVIAAAFVLSGVLAGTVAILLLGADWGHVSQVLACNLC